jgi:hypothetical protein
MVVIPRHCDDLDSTVQQALDATFKGPERFVHLVLGIDDVAGQNDHIYFPVDRRLNEALPDVSHGELVGFDWHAGRPAAQVHIAGTENLGSRHRSDSTS